MLNPSPSSCRARAARRTSAPSVLVFAYGSNLDEAQMVERCSSAQFVACGRLRSHTLRFAGFSAHWGGAVAHAARARGRVLRGVIYEMCRLDLGALDRCEGVPFAYQRVTRAIDCDDGIRREAEVYVQPAAGVELGPPSLGYLRQIVAAYIDHQFDTRAIARAVKESAPS
jgi:cation transport regulator ChaC